MKNVSMTDLFELYKTQSKIEIEKFKEDCKTGKYTEKQKEIVKQITIKQINSLVEGIKEDIILFGEDKEYKEFLKCLEVILENLKSI